MNIVIIKILQLILALAILISIHELGHFLFAKLFKIRVEKFFLFFDAGGFKLLSSKQGWFSKLFPKLKQLDTEYGIGWLPFGGYCKISGMIDESLDSKSLKEEAKEWEFRSKPVWQRFWVMFGGVFFNFILAITIYSFILAVWGDNYISIKNNDIYYSKLAQEIGFHNGDKIIRYDNSTPDDLMSLQTDLLRNKVKNVTVLRGKDTVNITINDTQTEQILNDAGMFQLAVPAIIDSIPENSPNYGKDLRKNDKVIELDNQNVYLLNDFRRILDKKPNATLEAKVLRGSDTVNVKIRTDNNAKAVIYSKQPNIERKKYSIIEAIPAGINKTILTIKGYIDDLKLVAQPSTGAYKSVGSFISIGKIFPSYWNLYSFLQILAILSIMLGVMNLLPIPGLDGGHIVFLIYEMISGRKASENFMTKAQIIGMIILFMLALYACGNDIVKLF